MSEADALNLENIRQRLLEERAALLESSEKSREGRRPVVLDQPSVGRLSRMDAMQGQAMAQATEERRQQRLRRIDAALERLDAGEFGECLVCGEAIAPKRLELDPTVPACLECAQGG